MVARLTVLRYPAWLAVAFLAAAAMLLGGTLGYVVRQATTPPQTKIVFVHQGSGVVSGQPGQDCIWLQGHKAR